MYGLSVLTMQTAVFLLDTLASVNLIHSALIPPGWRSNVKREALPTFRTPAKVQLNNEGPILITLHLRLGDLRTHVWSRIAPNLTVNMLRKFGVGGGGGTGKTSDSRALHI